MGSLAITALLLMTSVANADSIDVEFVPTWRADGAFAAIGGKGTLAQPQVWLVYNHITGELRVDASADRKLTSINIESVAGIFVGPRPSTLTGSFDNLSQHNIFKATFGSGFGSLSFGNVAQPGLTREFVVGDVCGGASIEGGGSLGWGCLDLIYVPEPGSFVLAWVGFVCLVAARYCGL